MRNFSTIGFALVTVAFLGGCGAYWNGSAEDETTVAKMKETQSAKAAAATPAAAPAADPSITETTSAAAPAAAAPMAAPAAKAKAMTDAEILGFLKTANSDELAMAAQAKKAKGAAADVKGFAATLATSHADGNKKELDVEKKSSVKADDSAADTASLKSDADGVVAKLKDAKAKEFDKAFIDSQVSVHQAMLDAIDGKLAPAAQDDNVKSYVASMRKNVADHLTKAQALQTKLSAGPASKKAKGAAAKAADSN